MSNHEFGGTRERSEQRPSAIIGKLSRKALALVLSGTVAFGLTSCAEEAKTTRETAFAVACSDQNTHNYYVPEIISVKQDSLGRRVTRRVEFGCPAGTDISVHEIKPDDGSPNSNSQTVTHIVVREEDCPASLDDSTIDWTYSNHTESEQQIFVMTLRSCCDTMKATVSK